jgi:LysR family transcriptional regulator, chromosome initiation inhibitor
MEWDLAQLRALATVVETGTFEAAASVLHVTPSAISQRIKTLEQSAGAVLLRRTRPVTPTEAGEPLLRIARQIEALTSEAERSGYAVSSARARVRLAVNADSMATWVLPALAPLAGDVDIELLREDQEKTTALLRDGSAMAAVTSQSEAVQGCSVSALGVMRYVPVAQEAFATRWFPGGLTTGALRAAPVVDFDRSDQLQGRWLEGHGVPRHEPPRHFVPASAEYGEAIALGYGWGMLPEQQLRLVEKRADLVVLSDEAIDVDLFWQQWSLRLDSLDAVGSALRDAARAHLRAPSSIRNE